MNLCQVSFSLSRSEPFIIFVLAVWLHSFSSNSDWRNLDICQLSFSLGANLVDSSCASSCGPLPVIS